MPSPYAVRHFTVTFSVPHGRGTNSVLHPSAVKAALLQRIDDLDHRQAWHEVVGASAEIAPDGDSQFECFAPQTGRADAPIDEKRCRFVEAVRVSTILTLGAQALAIKLAQVTERAALTDSDLSVTDEDVIRLSGVSKIDGHESWCLERLLCSTVRDVIYEAGLQATGKLLVSSFLVLHNFVEHQRRLVPDGLAVQGSTNTGVSP